jgi:hypothetical protein
MGERRQGISKEFWSRNLLKTVIHSEDREMGRKIILKRTLWK